jgi:signal transduction histidine kinase
MQLPNRPRQWPPWIVDGAIAVALAVISVIQLTNVTSADQELYRRAPDMLAYLLILAQTIPLALRRITPVPVLAFVVAGFFIDRGLDYPSTLATVGMAFAFHSLGSQLPRRRSLAIGLPVVALLTAFTISGVAYNESVEWESVIVVLIATAGPLFLGGEVYGRRRYLSELEERAALLERDREEQARRAVREERARIARELHDIVAHEMTVMTVQAAAARRMLERDTTEAADALSAIEEAGHDALTEMRRLLGLLRTEDQPAARAPQPGLGRLGGLVEQMEEAGLPVDVTVEGEPQPLPTGVDLNAYRIIQESLTNTLKHGGPGARATVRLVYGPGDLTVEIADDGRGAAQALAKDEAAGHGLVGMRERMAMLDGELRAGPRMGGGYRVSARIPVGQP